MKKIISILLGFILVSCSSAELVNNWKNPDIDSFAPAKILIIGMTSNDEARQKFEEKLKQKYQSRGVEAVTSYELFDESLMSYRRSEDDLIMLEDSLIKDGFDSVLLTKVAGVEDRTAFFNKFDKDTNYGFKYDYYNNQEIYFNRNYYDEYIVYHVET